MATAGGEASPTASSLQRHALCVPPTTTGSELAQLFRDQPTAPAFAVVDGDQPVGLVDRMGFLARFATLYGRDLYGNRPVCAIMDPAPLVVDCDMTVEAVCRQLHAVKPQALQTGFIVVRNGRYAGVAAGIDLLHAMLEHVTGINESLRNAQATLVQAEKMAALGGLVAGIAHEINTPIGSALTAATAFCEKVQIFSRLAAGALMRRSDLERFVAAAIQAGDHISVNIGRARELITSFKQVAVDQTSDVRRTFNLRQCLDDTLTSLHPRLRRAGVIAPLSCPATVDLDSYPGALVQIITNLVMNALQHGLDGQAAGTITLTANPAVDSVTIIVRDDGKGISPEILPRIFDPFFTTRRGGGGTGLGLNIVYNLVTYRLGGTITVDGNPGAGAAFHLSLPRKAPDPAQT